MNVIIFGGGPAGLSAAYEACRLGLAPVLYEKGADVGGLSRTVNYKGYLFDIGGHRFFSKDGEIRKIWEDVLGPELLVRPRLSRIYYRNRFFDYPLKPLNALANLGPKEAARVLSSYARSRFAPRKPPANFEEWATSRFGRRLFQIFFESYTEKVWGMPCTEIQADWAAQRIKSLSLPKAVLGSLRLLRKDRVATLIEEFRYPRKGPGQMWNEVKNIVEKNGGHTELRSRLVRLMRKGNLIIGAEIDSLGVLSRITGDHYLSSLPLRDLVALIDPPPPDPVIQAARMLRYRDFFTVGLIVKKSFLFRDNWIYIHAPDVKVGRIQNFKNWSPDMVPDQETTSLGLEYFCNRTDPIWKEPDGALIGLGIEELARLGFSGPADVSDGIVIRSPDTYPVYDDGYRERVGIVRDYLGTIANFQTIGRNGLHRYNNQDHSMLSALYAVRNIAGGRYRVWEINIDDEYLEAGVPDGGEFRQFMKKGSPPRRARRS